MDFFHKYFVVLFMKYPFLLLNFYNFIVSLLLEHIRLDLLELFIYILQLSS